MEKHISRQTTLDSLRISPLSVGGNSVVIGKIHQSVIQEKRHDFHQLIKQQKHEFEEEAQEYLELHGLCRNTEDAEYMKLRQEQQTRLHKLQDECQERLNQLFHRFQREWLLNPRETDENIDLSRLEGNQNGCYVAQAVGRALELGLTEVCQHQPEDPIEYLAMWLKSYSARCEREKQKLVDAMKLEVAAEELNLAVEIKHYMKIEVSNMKKDEHRRKEQYWQRINKTGKGIIITNTDDSHGLKPESSDLVENSTVESKTINLNSSLLSVPTEDKSEPHFCNDKRHSNFGSEQNQVISNGDLTDDKSVADNGGESGEEEESLEEPEVGSALYTIDEKDFDESPR